MAQMIGILPQTMPAQPTLASCPEQGGLAESTALSRQSASSAIAHGSMVSQDSGHTCCAALPVAASASTSPTTPVGSPASLAPCQVALHLGLQNRWILSRFPVPELALVPLPAALHSHVPHQDLSEGAVGSRTLSSDCWVCAGFVASTCHREGLCSDLSLRPLPAS